MIYDFNTIIYSCFLDHSGMYSGMGYPSSIFNRAGTGMGKFFYPHADMGILASKILSSGYGYGMALPDRYISVPISNPHPP